MEKLKHLVMYSGGGGSYILSKRVIEKYGKENVILLFADVKWEDDDLYRFIKDCEIKLGKEVIKLENGLSVPELMKKKNFLFNSRVASCSKILKADVVDKYISDNFDINNIVCHFGIDFTEAHRAPKIQNHKKYKCEFLLIDEKIDKNEMLEEIKNDGIELPNLYLLGFSHNNCGGRCIKGGQGHFINLLNKLPKRFDELVELEKYFTDKYGYEVTILRKTRKGVKSRYPLLELKKDYLLLKENEKDNVVKIEQLQLDLGACSCFSTD